MAYAKKILTMLFVPGALLVAVPTTYADDVRKLLLRLWINVENSRCSQLLMFLPGSLSCSSSFSLFSNEYRPNSSTAAKIICFWNTTEFVPWNRKNRQRQLLAQHHLPNQETHPATKDPKAYQKAQNPKTKDPCTPRTRVYSRMWVIKDISCSL